MLGFHAQAATRRNCLASFSYRGDHERSCSFPSAGDGEHLERSTEIEHFDIIKYDDANAALLLKAGLCLHHDSKMATAKLRDSPSITLIYRRCVTCCMTN